MTDELLESIFQLEELLQAEVANEEVRANTWQNRELAELECLLSRTKANEEKRCQQSLEEQEVELQQEVIKIEAEAEAWCKRIAGLDDATLSEVLKHKLAEILPGGDHDHPHGQG